MSFPSRVLYVCVSKRKGTQAKQNIWDLWKVNVGIGTSHTCLYEDDCIELGGMGCRWFRGIRNCRTHTQSNVGDRPPCEGHIEFLSWKPTTVRGQAAPGAGGERDWRKCAATGFFILWIFKNIHPTKKFADLYSRIQWLQPDEPAVDRCTIETLPPIHPAEFP